MGRTTTLPEEIDKRFYGLSSSDVGIMAFQLALRNNLPNPFSRKKGVLRKKFTCQYDLAIELQNSMRQCSNLLTWLKKNLHTKYVNDRYATKNLPYFESNSWYQLFHSTTETYNFPWWNDRFANLLLHNSKSISNFYYFPQSNSLYFSAFRSVSFSAHS